MSSFSTPSLRPSSPAERSDRAPTFDPNTGRWHWWSTPGQPSSLEHDQARAEEVTIEWTLDDSDAQHSWVGILPTLPGFAPFMWNLSKGFLWLRRPEGVWKARTPKYRRKDVLVVHERGEPWDEMPSGLRLGIMCLPMAPVLAWHNHNNEISLTLEEKDSIDLHGTMWGNIPVLVSNVPQSRNPNPPNGEHHLEMDLWSRPGTCRFFLADLCLNPKNLQEQERVLITTLPNGVHVAHRLTTGWTGSALWDHRLFLAQGGQGWMPRNLQKVIINDASTISKNEDHVSSFQR